MRISLAVPTGAGPFSGNRVTAGRWERLLRDLGHDVEVGDAQTGDVLVALHAGHCATAVTRWRATRGDAPVVLALTGTDIYRDLATSVPARRAVALADRLVVLQPLAVEELPEDQRDKARVIYQSVEPVEPRVAPQEAPDPDHFPVCQLAHLRAVKDPLLGAAAVRLLPEDTRVVITHFGDALDEELGARAAAAKSSRYQWRGAVPHTEALGVLARSALLLLTSRLEGGANVVSEALALGVPVVSSRIPGSVGLLGVDYPGYFPAGDASACAALLHRVETNAGFLARLAEGCRARAWLADPAEERRRWSALLDELDPAGA